MPPPLTEKLLRQAVALPGSAKEDGSESAIYRSPRSFDEAESHYGHLKTMVDVLEEGLKHNASSPFLGHRPAITDPLTGAKVYKPYEWQTYKTVNERRIDFGCGLMKVYKDTLKEAAKEKWFLGIYAINRPEWVIADLAAISFANATVPLYDTLGPDAAEFILTHAQLPVVVTSIDKVSILLSIAERCPDLKVIISMDSEPANSTFSILQEWAKEKGLVLLTFAHVETLGKQNRIPLQPPKESDPLCISYTSGTTGNPKGAILTHKNMVTMLKAVWMTDLRILPEDVHLSYLPLAHLYERVTYAACLLFGTKMGFYRGDVALILDDLATLRPTLFISVPRLYNRIHDRILSGVSQASPLVQALFRTALNAKIANYENEGVLTHTVWDTLVFKKIQGLLGGRIRIMASASAPISGDVMRFLMVVFGCPVLEGYGQTESAGGITGRLLGDLDPGHVGGPFTCCEMKLVAVPEMDYRPTDKPFPRGEIWARGPSIFAGYLHDPEKTRETVTEDGWLKTGDIGVIDDRGRLFIVDRKKNIFK
ncbi:Long chain acyl-CoA synthetase 7 peroxisomal, partial [Chytridiales sp. JEL 0842]